MSSLLEDVLKLPGLVRGIEIRTINNERYRFDKTNLPQVPGYTMEEIILSTVKNIVSVCTGEIQCFATPLEQSAVCIPGAHIHHVMFDFTRPSAEVFAELLAEDDE